METFAFGMLILSAPFGCKTAGIQESQIQSGKSGSLQLLWGWWERASNFALGYEFTVSTSVSFFFSNILGVKADAAG